MTSEEPLTSRLFLIVEFLIVSIELRHEMLAFPIEEEISSTPEPEMKNGNAMSRPVVPMVEFSAKNELDVTVMFGRLKEEGRARRKEAFSMKMLDLLRTRRLPFKMNLQFLMTTFFPCSLMTRSPSCTVTFE